MNTLDPRLRSAVAGLCATLGADGPVVGFAGTHPTDDAYAYADLRGTRIEATGCHDPNVAIVALATRLIEAELVRLGSGSSV